MLLQEHSEAPAGEDLRLSLRQRLLQGSDAEIGVPDVGWTGAMPPLAGYISP